MNNEYEIGNVYYDYVKGIYSIIIGYKNFDDDSYAEGFLSTFRSMSSISPYIYEEPDLVIKDWLQRNVEYLIYETNNKDFLKEPIILSKVSRTSLSQLRNFLIKRETIRFYKKLSKKELDTWLLKNKLAQSMPNDISTDMDLLCASMKNVFLKTDIKKDTYIKRYIDSRFMSIKNLPDSKCRDIGVIKGYKNNHVFLIIEKDTVSPKKVELTGYLLKTFKQSELLETLNYVDDIGFSCAQISYTKEMIEKNGKQKEIRVVDNTKVDLFSPKFVL